MAGDPPKPPVDPATCTHTRRIPFTHERDRCEDCGERLPLTPEEIARRDAEAAAFHKEAF